MKFVKHYPKLNEKEHLVYMLDMIRRKLNRIKISIIEFSENQKIVSPSACVFYLTLSDPLDKGISVYDVYDLYVLSMKTTNHNRPPIVCNRNRPSGLVYKKRIKSEKDSM